MAALKRTRPQRHPSSPWRPSSLPQRGIRPGPTSDRPASPRWVAAGLAMLVLLALAADEAFRFDPTAALAANRAKRLELADQLAEQEKRQADILRVQRVVGGTARPSDHRIERDAAGIEQDFLNARATALDGFGGFFEPRYESREHKLREAAKYLVRSRAEIAATLAELDALAKDDATIRASGPPRESYLRRVLGWILH